jgi:hypothetical protein
MTFDKVWTRTGNHFTCKSLVRHLISFPKINHENVSDIGRNIVQGEDSIIMLYLAFGAHWRYQSRKRIIRMAAVSYRV